MCPFSNVDMKGTLRDTAGKKPRKNYIMQSVKLFVLILI